MSGRYLLDTNIIIALFAGEAKIKSNLTRSEEVFIPNIAIGELCYGARKSERSQANLARVDELIANSTVLGCNTEIAREFRLDEFQSKLEPVQVDFSHGIPSK